MNFLAARPTIFRQLSIAEVDYGATRAILLTTCPLSASHHLTIFSRSILLYAPPRLSLAIKKRRIPILKPCCNTSKLDISNREGTILALWTGHWVAQARRQRLLELRSDEVEMNKAIEISMMPNLREEVSTHKLQIKKFVPYVPNMTISRSVPPPGRNTQSKIKQTSNPMPSIRSNTRWMGVPVNPLA